MINRIIVAIIGLSLIGTMTNLIYTSAFASIFAVIFIPVLFIKNQYNIPKFLMYLWFFTLYSLMSVVVYYPLSFLDFMFYRYDGNFFISYLPLLVFPVFAIKFNIEKYLKFFIYVACIINLILYLIYFVKTKGGVLFSPTAIRNNFNPLFIANNAAGGFYSILFSLLFAFYTNNKKKQYVFFMLCCILFLWGTASRGSMLGVICGFGCYVLYKKGRSKLIYLMIGAIIIIQAIIIYNTYPYYKTYLLNNMKNQLTIDFSIESTKEANVYLRAVEMWPRAVFVFANSPIFGSGFGAVNDKPFDFSGISGFISIHNHGNKIFDSSHAHHSFLHILAEEGIVGLSLFLLFWINLYKYIISKKRHYSNIIRVFLIIAFFNLTFMSFTEHRITTPSNALPFILILVLALIYDNSQTKHISK